MNEAKEVSIDVSPDDVGCDEYSGYRITHINYHEEDKQIWSITYDYSWECGDGCCSDTCSDMAYSGQIAKWLKDYIIERYMTGYTFECP